MFSKTKIILSLIVIIGAYLAGYFSHKYSDFFDEKFGVQIRQDSAEYEYINPLLFVANSEIDYPELDGLKNQLKKYIDKKISQNEAEKISVYFREMDTGKWTGVGEDELYAPSSMLKIVTLMAYLKKASDDDSLFTQRYYYKYEENPGQFYKPVPLASGYQTGLALLQQMIIHSDNTAMDLIDEDHIPNIIELYKDLKLASPIGSPDDFMSPRMYSRFLRALYNATYLSKTYSEQALKLLTYVNFSEGLKQGVPETVPIAHKFGEHTLLKDGVLQYRELHDCGIVYYPNEPYLLCVMTQGQEFSKLADAIGEISTIVFKYQEDHYDQ